LRNYDRRRLELGYLPNNHATGYVYTEHQVSMCAGETIASKSKIEKALMQQGVQVKQNWGCNHLFKGIQGVY
jgi:hypothetical protein